MIEPSTEAPPLPARQSPWSPLAQPVFRMLWGVWFASNICMWMNDVASAWMMTTLTASPVMVALVQSASSLPVFLLGLPSGALADIIDRRRYLIFTQFWVASVGTLLCIVTLFGAMTAPLLLVLTFANGIGLAMRWPAFSALIPELIARPQLPAALALNAISMNMSRIVGPIVAGALIASLGSAYVFLLNAAISIASGIFILRWRSERKVSALPGERFLGAMRVGMQYVRQSRRMHAILLRIFSFFFQAAALTALLPLLARALPGGDAATFTLLLAAMGAGAVLVALNMGRVRQWASGDALIRNGALLQAAATAAMAFAPSVWVALPLMFVSGIATICVANALSVSAQLALPNWVRARGMSIYQMSLMGGGAIGAGIWGQLAALTSLRESLLVAAVGGAVMMMLIRRAHELDSAVEEDLTPSALPRPPALPAIDPSAGPVLTTIEYRIDPARADEFRAVMQQSRRSRLRQGALSWELFRDAAEPGRYVEYIVDESWVEHLRRFDRISSDDLAWRERRLALHVGHAPPLVTRCIAESVGRG
ncbi:MAG: MFS transporter [Burkholderiaceae bacterium]